MTSTLTCRYCRNPFTPTQNGDGTIDDLDGKDVPCCDECFCADCDHGHDPDEVCPKIMATAEDDYLVAYGDPDDAYDRLLEPCLLDC